MKLIHCAVTSLDYRHGAVVFLNSCFSIQATPTNSFVMYMTLIHVHLVSLRKSCVRFCFDNTKQLLLFSFTMMEHDKAVTKHKVFAVLLTHGVVSGVYSWMVGEVPSDHLADSPACYSVMV